MHREQCTTERTPLQLAGSDLASLSRFVAVHPRFLERSALPPARLLPPRRPAADPDVGPDVGSQNFLPPPPVAKCKVAGFRCASYSQGKHRAPAPLTYVVNLLQSSYPRPARTRARPHGGAIKIMTRPEHLHAIELPTPFPVGPVTVYLGDAPGEPLTLVDTGPRSSRTRAALDVGLAALGYKVPDIDRIVVSHAHADHFGLAADLQAESGAKVVTHVWNRDALAGYREDRERRTEFYAQLLRRAAVPVEILVTVYEATRAVNQFAAPVDVNVTVDEGDEISLAGCRWRVLHTPGHSAGLVCLYEPASAMLLSSDHLLADISSNPVVELSLIHI